MQTQSNELGIWLREEIAKRLKVPAQQIGLEVPFDQYGLDSLSIVSVAADLEEKIGFDIDPSWFYEHRSIALLCGKIAQHQESARAN